MKGILISQLHVSPAVCDNETNFLFEPTAGEIRSLDVNDIITEKMLITKLYMTTRIVSTDYKVTPIF